MPVDLVIDIENTPGALARVAAAISDADLVYVATRNRVVFEQPTSQPPSWARRRELTAAV